MRWFSYFLYSQNRCSKVNSESSATPLRRTAVLEYVYQLNLVDMVLNSKFEKIINKCAKIFSAHVLRFQ